MLIVVRSKRRQDAPVGSEQMIQSYLEILLLRLLRKSAPTEADMYLAHVSNHLLPLCRKNPECCIPAVIRDFIHSSSSSSTSYVHWNRSTPGYFSPRLRITKHITVKLHSVFVGFCRNPRRLHILDNFKQHAARPSPLLSGSTARWRSVISCFSFSSKPIIPTVNSSDS